VLASEAISWIDNVRRELAKIAGTEPDTARQMAEAIAADLGIPRALLAPPQRR
jgi:hypothetical protein